MYHCFVVLQTYRNNFVWWFYFCFQLIYQWGNIVKKIFSLVGCGGLEKIYEWIDGHRRWDGGRVKSSARYGIWLLYVVKNCRRHSNICNRVEKIYFLLSHQKIENCHFLKTKHPSVNDIFNYSDTYWTKMDI